MTDTLLSSKTDAFIERLRRYGRFYVVPVDGSAAEVLLENFLRQHGYTFSIPILPGETLDQAMQRLPAKKNDSVVYAPCEKHTGMTFRAVVLAGPLFRKVCPACLPSHPLNLGDSVRTGQEGQS